MLSEVARTEDVVVGHIVDEVPVVPYADADEARQVMSDAFRLLRQGRDLIQDGHDLLKLAEAREAWKILGFATWQACVLDGAEKHLRTHIEPEYRRELVVDMRKRYGVSTRALSARLGVSHMTTHRDLTKAREAGELVDEGDTVVSTDGSTRQARQKKPRVAFSKSWETQATRLIKALASLHKLREDDRWKANSPDLAVKWKADLSRALDQYGDLLEDLNQAYKEIDS